MEIVILYKLLCKSEWIEINSNFFNGETIFLIVYKFDMLKILFTGIEKTNLVSMSIFRYIHASLYTGIFDIDTDQIRYRKFYIELYVKLYSELYI